MIEFGAVNRPLTGLPSLRPRPTVMEQTRVAPHALVGVAARGLSVATYLDEDRYVAIEDRTAMFGEGASPADARQDLLASLRALRDDLAGDEQVLSPRLRSQLDFLRSLNL